VGPGTAVCCLSRFSLQAALGNDRSEDKTKMRATCNPRLLTGRQPASPPASASPRLCAQVDRHISTQLCCGCDNTSSTIRIQPYATHRLEGLGKSVRSCERREFRAFAQQIGRNRVYRTNIHDQSTPRARFSTRRENDRVDCSGSGLRLIGILRSRAPSVSCRANVPRELRCLGNHRIVASHADRCDGHRSMGLNYDRKGEK
jgi:hypothetical protein